jgi:hypothetical protein
VVVKATHQRQTARLWGLAAKLLDLQLTRGEDGLGKYQKPHPFSFHFKGMGPQGKP